jgi:hypothetical protein
MAHFAEIDADNKVLRVIAVNDADTADENGVEVEAIGRQFCADLVGGTWIQTSYNHNIRRRFVGAGDFYEPANDVFITAPPTDINGNVCESWVLDENFDWAPPIPLPDTTDEDCWYYWDENDENWVTPPNRPSDDLFWDTAVREWLPKP